MAAGEIDVECSAGVAVLTLAAPERRNALSESMAGALIEACDRIDADPSVGAVVVRGAGGYFCAGADRALLAAAGADPAREREFSSLGLVYRCFARIGELAPPTVAAILGGAVGAGLNLALACDVRVIATDARLQSGFLHIGLHPGGGHFALLGRAAGPQAAAAMALLGEIVDGARAVELGLAWEALPSAEVEPRALALAARAAADPALARSATRSLRSLLGPPAASWPVALEAERAAQMWSLRRRRED